MFLAKLLIYIIALALALLFGAYVFALATSAQTIMEREYRTDVQRALRGRTDFNSQKRRGRDSSLQTNAAKGERPQSSESKIARAPSTAKQTNANAVAQIIGAGTPLSRVLHTSQLSLSSSAGTDEQFVDRNNDLVSDERTTFDNLGGSFDIAVGQTGARYEVYAAVDDHGTGTTNDDENIGVLVVALDTNGDYVRDSSTTFNLKRDFGLPSAAAIVTGTSKSGREFVIVSSSGYYNYSNPNDPFNEPTAGVVLLVRDPNTGGFDNTRSRELVKVGNNQIYNANALALLPNNDLLIADFDKDQLHIVRDTNADGMPDTFDTTPYYSYRFSNDAPLDIAVNSRGVVFSHSYGNDAVMLALYDDNRDGRADRDEVIIEGLSLDNNLFFHGLAVDRVGTIYVIEDASGNADTSSSGGNGGTPRIDAFPDSGLNGFPQDSEIFSIADGAGTQAYSGLSLGQLPSNQINDSQFFVTQHYRDFLGREPDAGGLAYWSGQIDQCGTNAACINNKRIDVSAAYFIELEFQDTGYFVYRLYRASYGLKPTYAQFTPDRALVVGGANLEQSKQQFADAWVQRAAFQQAYPSTMTPEQFVGKLFDTAGLVPYTQERQQLANDMRAGKTRSQVLREVIEIAEFKTREYNPAFVTMQYFGYLKRDYDQGGYDFWLNVLNNREPNNYRGMVCSFITSREYQERFGLALARSNADCAQ
ncbi:MAG: DUF4214 domain-containing protein [Pyrinomonadaceae bacterium]